MDNNNTALLLQLLTNPSALQQTLATIAQSQQQSLSMSETILLVPFNANIRIVNTAANDDDNNTQQYFNIINTPSFNTIKDNNTQQYSGENIIEVDDNNNTQQSSGETIIEDNNDT
ncbi:20483_t:CDS:2 [Dentiscutata erythropus]|uniref:20483_t:CDS:1 n=1 Tax=Dentiscutata erythropus TaxID=1348616 RepID=A0A9N9NML0_9GLOM|nr:20483_t:CDS:2 [Dentiscutata erythropus]